MLLDCKWGQPRKNERAVLSGPGPLVVGDGLVGALAGLAQVRWRSSAGRGGAREMLACCEGLVPYRLGVFSW